MTLLIPFAIEKKKKVACSRQMNDVHHKKQKRNGIHSIAVYILDYITAVKPLGLKSGVICTLTYQPV